MFGGYGIFHDSAMFALISKDRLYFKVDDSNRSAYENVGSICFTQMPYYEVPANVVQEESVLCCWAQKSIDIAHNTPKKKRS
jgi:DNA transformation protein